MSKDLTPNVSPAPLSEVTPEPRWCLPAVILALMVGFALMIDSIGQSSATYDETTYLQIATRWWRTGDQSMISRMGSPVLFWKIQQAPVLWVLDRLGHGDWIDGYSAHEEQLLLWVRVGSLWIWGLALVLVAVWSRWLYGPRAMALAAWIFALSPNLLGHGSLATMETPLLVGTTGMFMLFWKFLQTGDRRFFWATAAMGGLAWSLKYTTVLVPPMLAVVWWLDRWRKGEREILRLTRSVTLKMVAFLAVMGGANLLLTQFAMLPLSQSRGNHPGMESLIPPRFRPWVASLIEVPVPQEIVGFANQMLMQRNGGPSYLMGERRNTGWWYYYFVAMGVKVPLAFWAFVVGRMALGRRLTSAGHETMLLMIMAMFLTITALASSRNFGVRYLFPIAPVAIVWVSGLAESVRISSLGMRRLAAAFAVVGILGQATAIVSIHPYELSYFNQLAGGPVGGRRILSDSNLDWGQGLKPLAQLQKSHPEFQKLTLYYFGNTDPRSYGVVGVCHWLTADSIPSSMPSTLSSSTPYVAVSTSLEWGPWGPETYFRGLRGKKPVQMTADYTIAIYRAEDVMSSLTLRAN